ncbi:hypothetical protein IDJ75_12050 [Mucilaginibacter rigui]|uniref:DUF308 domain-containing protein n=1 Tax=Mucilaginibacter rigui TaxID=534635 RepID=A0ABR7X613_9SPHI|nr:hypothetical protein [Mucilaginibacter rigui]MBD1386016.1 hypothetical protein [Mucilaginibacter rigui]
MEKEPHRVPEATVKGNATGLFMMALFTMIWAGIAYGGLHGTAYALLLFIFPLLSIYFIVKGVALFRIAKNFPKLTDEEDIAEEKRRGKWFGIVFGAEGLGIFIGINIVVNLGHPELTIPVIALVVGLHFYPMGKIFKRTIDYYLATWSTIIAVCGIVFTLKKLMPANSILAFLGVGLAIATSCYGLNMAKRAANLLSV